MTFSGSPEPFATRTLRADDADGIVALDAAAMAVERDIGPITPEGWTGTMPCRSSAADGTS